MKNAVYLTQVPLEQIIPGTQVIYIPLHADHDPDHKDVEEGFVTSVRNDGRRVVVFVRFFRQRGSGLDLRTSNSSSSCDLHTLAFGCFRDQDTIDRMTSEALMQASLYWKPGMLDSLPMTQAIEQGADPGVS